MKKRFLSILITIALCIGLLPSFSLSVNAVTTNMQKTDDLRTVVNSAASGDVIDLGGQDFSVNDDTSKSTPWVISKEVTIQNGGIDLRAGGIILGANVTFKNVQLHFANPVRNVIAANGYELTLESVSRGKNSNGSNSSQQFHLVCGSMISLDGTVGGISMPNSGSHGQIIIKGSNIDIGNIYAGHISTDGLKTPSSIPATITIAAESGSIGMQYSGVLPQANVQASVEEGIFSTGALQTPTPGLTLDTSYVQMPPLPLESIASAPEMNAKVTINIKDGMVKRIHGQTGSSAYNSEVIYNGNDSGVSKVVLKEVGTLTVNSGKLGPDKSGSLSNTNINLTGNGKLGLTEFIDPSAPYSFTEIGNLSGGGTLILGQSQQLIINGSVSGSTKIAIGSGSYDMDGSAEEPTNGFTYINTSQGASDTAFSLAPYGGKQGITLEHDAGQWTAKHSSVSAISLSYPAPPSSLLAGQQMQPLNPQISGGDGSYTYSIESGNLPVGVELNPSTGIISGQPAAVNPQTSQIVVRVSDNSGNSTTAQIEFPAIGKAVDRISVSDSQNGMVAVPTREQGNVVLNLSSQAIYSDQSNADITAQTSFALEGSAAGVQINNQTITLTPQAKAGVLNIRWSYGTENGIHRITLTKDGAGVPALMNEISGSTSITVDKASEQKHQYQVSVLDAYGETVALPVVWSVTGIDGVVIDPASGLLTIPAVSPAGILNITARIDRLTKTKTVTLSEASVNNPVYRIVFEAGEGSGNMGLITVGKGDSYTLPANGFTAPEGKIFKHWEINGISYQPNDSVIINENTTVKAVWENVPVSPTPDEEQGSTTTPDEEQGSTTTPNEEQGNITTPDEGQGGATAPDSGSDQGTTKPNPGGNIPALGENTGTAAAGDTVQHSSQTVPVPVHYKTTSSVNGITTTVSGVYILNKGFDVAILTTTEEIVVSHGLMAGERAFAKVTDMDVKKSYLAKKCLDDTTAAYGGVTVGYINMEIGRMSHGKYSAMEEKNGPIRVMLNIPSPIFVEEARYAMVRVHEGGKVDILNDLDTVAKTITFKTTAQAAAYAIIKY